MLKENESKFLVARQIVPLICEKIGSDVMINNVLSKHNSLEQYHLSVHSTILKIEDAAQKNLVLWNNYHSNLDRCREYLTQQENEIALYDGSILNLSQLQNIILQLYVSM